MPPVCISMIQIVLTGGSYAPARPAQHEQT